MDERTILAYKLQLSLVRIVLSLLLDRHEQRAASGHPPTTSSCQELRGSLENSTVSRQAGRLQAGRNQILVANSTVSRLRAAGGWMAALHPHGSDAEDSMSGRRLAYTLAYGTRQRPQGRH
jgi:hypothetical protein